MGFFGSREFGGFMQRVTMVWVSSLCFLAILGGLLGKRTIEHMELQSTFPPFYISN
jgi:preprotein translocase subunit SecG